MITVKIAVKDWEQINHVEQTFNDWKEISTFPNERNAFLYYKQEKEKYIKEVADKWKDSITKQVYNAMYNYKITQND